MSDEIKNVIKVASVYMATVIGAGFASGQEIVQFFTAYEKGGLAGIILAGLLFSILGSLVLGKVYRGRIRNYNEFIYPLLGVKAGIIVETAATIFLFCLFSIMVAGAGNIISQKTGLTYTASVAVMSIICMLLILTSIRGITILSMIITPVLIAGIVITGLYIITCRDISVFSVSGLFHNLTYNWFASSILYVGYNSIMSIMLMTSMLAYLKTERTARLGGMLGGLLLCFAALVLYLALYFNYSAATYAELPVLQVLAKYDAFAGIFYSILLWLAMLVSAVTSGYCFIDRISRRPGKKRITVTIAVCAAAVPLSNIGFSSLISYVYPAFGYLGLFIAMAVILQGISERIGKRFN